MNGIFKKNAKLHIVLTVCGALLSALSIFAFFDESIKSKALTEYVFAFSLPFFIGNFFMIFFNRNAYLSFDETYIDGKYNWRGKIYCPLSEIDFITYNANTLIIMEEDGKQHRISGLTNLREVAAFLRKNVPFDSYVSSQSFKDDLFYWKETKKKLLIITIVGCVLLFINIFVTVYLTDGKELYEFSSADKNIMIIFMGFLEPLILICTFVFADKCGKTKLPIEKALYSLNRLTVENTPLPSGNVKKVFTDYNYSQRITLLTNPDDTITVIIEKINFDVLEQESSEIFKNEDSIPYLKYYTEI